MNVGLYLFFLSVSFGASALGAVCGIGGGVVIKPVLDACGVLSVSTVSFLSGCTVFSMTCYSVLKACKSKDVRLDLRVSTPLAAGAVMGGVAGKSLFQALLALFPDPDQAGAVQAACLFAVTLGTMLYTIRKKKITTYRVQGAVACMGIGLVLGLLSSFLGIGGGPVNLAVLFFCFSMDMKTAAQNSLYVIFFSQAASLIQSFITGSVPRTGGGLILLMAVSGVLGGMAGRHINKRIDDRMVGKLFILLMWVILLICIYNVYQFYPFSDYGC